MSKSKDFSVETRLRALEAELMEIKMLLKQSLDRSANTSSKPDEIINANQAVQLLGLPRHILYAKTTSGEIPGFRVGKLYKFKRADLLQWKKAQKFSNAIDTDDYVNRYLQTHMLKG